MAEQAIDGKFLKGLTFRSSKPVKDGDGNIKHQPTERALKPSDVLDWTEKGDTVVIVTADGQKHTVDKKAAEKAGKGEGEQK